jgi:RNA polymerase sigma factor (sigma-70 family)
VGLSDQSLIAGIASGDATAVTTLVRRYQARVYGLALRVTADSGLAEEVAQDAFVRAWRYATSYDARRGPVDRWLLTIAHNVSMDAVRRRRDYPVDPELLRRAQRSVPDERGYEQVEPVLAGLRSLPAEQARPIMLAVLYGLTAREIAEQEGIPLGTAKTRIRRGLGRLRVALADTTSRPCLPP